MNWKVHAISFFVLIFGVGVQKFVWDNPKVIVYLILGVFALLGYGAGYIIVKAKMENREKK